MFLTTGEIARRIGRPRYWVVYHIEAGHLPDAATRLGGRRVFTVAELEAIEVRMQAMAKDEASQEWKGVRNESR